MTWFKNLFSKKNDDSQDSDEVVDTNAEINNENTSNQSVEGVNKSPEEPAAEATEEPTPNVEEEKAPEEPVAESAPEAEGEAEVRKEE